MSDDLIDRIYEAAFVPDMWPSVLDDLSIKSQSLGGVLLVANEHNPPRWVASGSVRAAVQAFSEGEAWRYNDRPPRFLAAGGGGFVRDVDFMSETEVAQDPMREELVKFGLGWQTGAVLAMPCGAVVVYSLERRYDEGPHERHVSDLLNGLRPHLARAGMMAARLGLERAQAAVSALAALGLPAAVLTNAGRVLAANDLFEGMDRLFLPVAFGGLAIADAPANRLFQEAVSAARGAREPLVRSIPVKPTGERSATVIHILPLRRAAHDIFSGADILVVATEVRPDVNVPASRLLSALFDLTPAEARLAAALASGKSLKKTADDMKIGFGSARTYLARVFGKTGTNQQSELVALLKSVQF